MSCDVCGSPHADVFIVRTRSDDETVIVRCGRHEHRPAPTQEDR